jgi:hypothetical protein
MSMSMSMAMDMCMDTQKSMHIWDARAYLHARGSCLCAHGKVRYLHTIHARCCAVAPARVAASCFPAICMLSDLLPDSDLPQ